MRYVIARINESERVLTYRIYVTDGLRALVNDKAERYADLLKPKKQSKESAEDIIRRFKSNFGAEENNDGSV